MRDLKGHVDLLGLGNLVQLLSVNKVEGTLTVIKGNEKQAIHFGTTGIRLLSSTVARGKRLAKLARSLSRPVTPQRLKNLLKKEKLLGWTLGQIALSGGEVRKEDIQEALRKQVEEEILDLFVWSQAAFRFAEGRLPREKAAHPLAALAIHANVTSLLLEAARRADEVLRMRQTLTDDDLKLLKIPREIQADQLGEDLVRVDTILPLIDGRRTLKAIMQASIYPRFATMRAVHKLVMLGYVKAHDREGQTLILTQPVDA